MSRVPGAAAVLTRSRYQGLGPLTVATGIGSAGLAAGGTGGVLLGSDLAGSGGAGLPIAMIVIGSAAGAALVSWQAGQGRRRRGLRLGYLTGAAGALTVVPAAALGSLPLLLVGSVVLGVANSSVFMARYAALDAVSEPDRGKALGTVFAATAVGAVIGPVLLGPSGAAARAMGLPRLCGLYLVAVLAFTCAALVLGRENPPSVPPDREGTGIFRAIRDARLGSALMILALTNFVMVSIMAVAQVHLLTHGHGLDLIGVLIALHVAGMFAPSALSGRLVDRRGAAQVILVGFWLLFVAGLVGVLVDGHGVVVMAVHLVFLGLGWNCGVVGGSTLLASRAPPALRPRAEGIGETVMAVAAAVAAPVASEVVACAGYLAYAMVSTLLMFGGLVLLRRSLPDHRPNIWKEA